MAVTYDKANQTSGLNSDTRLNAELTKIQTALQDAVSRSGTSPNAMSANLDMGGYQIINALSVDTDSLTVNGSSVPDLATIQGLYAATQASAASAAADEGSAAASAAAAAASAAGVNLPSLGTAGQILQVNSGATALENHTPTSTATASAVARRDGSGRLQVATPTADEDAATKGYVDGLVQPTVTATGFTRTIATYRTNDASLPGDELTVVGTVPEGAFYTVGPAGSGATYTWARLADLPAEATTAIVVCEFGGYDTALLDASVYTEVYLGNTSGNLLRTSMSNDTTALKTITTETEVVLEANNVLSIKYLSTADNPYIKLRLVGFSI